MYSTENNALKKLHSLDMNSQQHQIYRYLTIWKHLNEILNVKVQFFWVLWMALQSTS